MPYGLNDSGAIVGEAEFEVPGVSGTYNVRAAHWANADSPPTDLGSLGKITTTGSTPEAKAKKPDEWGTSRAVAINNNGMIVGTSTHLVAADIPNGIYYPVTSTKAVRFNVGGKPTLLGPGKKDDTAISNYVSALSEGGVAVGMTSDYHTSPDYTGAALWDNGVFSKALGEDFTPTGITTAPSDDTRYKYYVIGTKKPDPDAPAPDPPAPAESGTRLKLKCKDSDDFVTKTLPIGSALGITTDGFAFTSAYSELSAASAAPAFHEWVNGNDEDITSKFFPHDGVVFNGLIAQAGNGMLGGSIAVTDPVTGKTKNDAALISNVEVRTVAHGDT